MGVSIMKTTTEMTLISIDKLIPYINNARTHSPEQITKLRSSLREFGFVNPVLIDRSFNIIAGHGRYEAAKAEGYNEVPCVYVDHLTEAQKKAYIIADNRMAMDAGWDEELLKVELEALEGESFDLYLTGNGFCKIARILTYEGIKSYTGKTWTKTTIGEILSNITYTGTLHLQKTYRENHITKKTKRNKGEKPLYIVENNHEAIVSKDIFEEVQRIRKIKAVGKKGKRRGPVYPFTGLISCGECGHIFKHKITKYYENWVCSQYDDLGKDYCASKKIRDDVLRKATAQALNLDSFDEDILKERISSIEAFNGNRLVFHLKDGTTKEVIWQNPSRKDSWTDEMKLKAKERWLNYGKR